MSNLKENASGISQKLFQTLKELGLNFFVSVPCKFLAPLLDLLENDSEIIYTPVTREEEGVGICAGAYLAGKKPAIVMQNSGIGNCINAICALLNYFRLPVVFIISHRGSEGEAIDAQKPMGDATKPLLETVNVTFYEINSEDDLYLIEQGIHDAYKHERSVAFLFPINFWEKQYGKTLKDK